MEKETYIFDNDGECYKVASTEKAKLKDGRHIETIYLLSKVDLDKDQALKEYFASW